MLTYKNDSLLFNETANDLIKNNKKNLIFLDKDRKILNLFSAFVKKDDFVKNNKRILPLQRTPYITGKKIANQINKLIENLPREYRENNHQKIRLIIKEYVNRSSKIKINDYHKWFRYKRFPLVFIRILAGIKSKITKIKEKSILADLLKDCILVDCHGEGTFLPNIQLNSLLTEKQFYLMGCIFGDGCLAKNNYMSIIDGTSNEKDIKYSEEFLTNLKELIRELYGDLNIKTNKEKNKCVLYVTSKWFCRYINFFFRIPIGYKKDKLSYPQILFLAKNKERLEKVFWRGMFDTDGFQYQNSRNAGLSSHNLKMINECKKFLQKYKINSKENKLERGYSLMIYFYDFLKFANTVGFSHPRKQKYLKHWIKKKHDRNIIFESINKQKMYHEFFDLSLLPLRVYKIPNLIKKYKGNFSCKKLSEILNIPRSTIFGWISGNYGIPIQKLFEIAKLQGYTKLDVFNELNQSKEIRFCLIKNKGRGNAIKFPLKVNEDLVSISKYLRTSFPKMHIINKIDKNFIQKDKIIELIKEMFGVKVRLQKSGIHRIDSATLTKFFETFFVYNYSWKPLDDRRVNKLIEELNRIWC